MKQQPNSTTTEQKPPLWKVLNEQRTQGEIEAWESDNLFYLRKVENGFIIGEIPDKEDADYATLAVNNLHILAEALEADFEILKWIAHEFNDNTRIKDILTKRIEATEEALNKIS